MPAPPSAPAAAPASTCLRVRRTRLLRRVDEDEAAQHVVEVLPHLPIGERRRDVLTHGVERSRVAPGVEHVPLVGVLVDVVDHRGDSRFAHLPARVAEAWDQLAGVRVGVHALRYANTVRIAAQVHVLLAAGGAWAGFLPYPAHEVAAVLADLVDVVPAAPDHAVEGIRYPRRTVDRRMDAVGEPLPTGARLRRAARGRISPDQNGVGFGSCTTPTAAGEREHAQQYDPEPFHRPIKARKSRPRGR